MQFASISKALASAVALVLFSAVALADVSDKKTILTVNETIEVPGATLEPGEYVVKLVDSQSNKHIVRFLNKEEDQVLSTVIAIPNLRLEPTGDTEFAWHETPAGQPPALKAWFYPGDTYGQEFAYPEGRAAELSAASNQEVPSLSDEDAAMAANQTATDQERTNQETAIAQTPTSTRQQDATERQAAQRERAREIASQRSRDLQEQRDRERADRERAQIAQASPNQQPAADRSLTAQQSTQNQTTQNQTTQNELPETAGLSALLALIGLSSLGAAGAVRKLRRK